MDQIVNEIGMKTCEFLYAISGYSVADAIQCQVGAFTGDYVTSGWYAILFTVFFLGGFGLSLVGLQIKSISRDMSISFS